MLSLFNLLIKNSEEFSFEVIVIDISICGKII